MIRSRFVPNPLLVEQLELHPVVAAYIESRAEEGADAIRQVAAGLTAEGDDDLADSIEVDGATVYSTDPGAPFIELGTEDTPPLAPFRKGVEQAGATYRNDGGED